MWLPEPMRRHVADGEVRAVDEMDEWDPVEWPTVALSVIRRCVAKRTKGSPGLKPEAQNPVSGLLIIARLDRGHRNRAEAVAAAGAPERLVHWLERVRRAETLLQGIGGPNARWDEAVVDRYLTHLGLTRSDLARVAEGPRAGLDAATLRQWLSEPIAHPSTSTR